MDACGLGGGTCISVNAANVYAYPVLAFVAQLRKPPLKVLQVAEHFNRKLIHGAYRWLPDPLIPNTRTFLKCDAEVHNLDEYCFSIRLRVVCSNSIPWEKDMNKIDRMGEVNGREDSRSLMVLAARDSWRMRLPCVVLRETAVEGEKLKLIRFENGKWDATGDVSPFSGKKVASVQTWFSLMMKFRSFGMPSPTNGVVIDILSPRLRRWSAEGCDAGADTKRMLGILFSEGGNLPACLKFSFLQSNCFGWYTDRRFQTRPLRPCVLGCGSSDGVDDLCHYGNCCVLWKAYARLGLGILPPDLLKLRHFLVLDGELQVPLRLAFLHACMVSVHKLRGPHSNLDVSTREHFIRSNFKVVVCRSQYLKDAFNLLWSAHGWAL